MDSEDDLAGIQVDDLDAKSDLRRPITRDTNKKRHDDMAS